MRRCVLLVLVLLLVPTTAGTQAGSSGDAVPLLVSMETWPTPRATEIGLEAVGGTVVERFESARTLLVRAPAGSASAIEGVAGVAEVTADEPLTWTLASSKQAVRAGEDLEAAGVTGEGVNIALVDSGVDPNHPGLRDNLVGQHSFSSDGRSQGAAGLSKHGTHVAGVLVGTGAGAGPDRGDVSGMAPGSGLVSLDISEQFTTSNALRAMEWVYENHDEEEIQVLANSWGRQRDPARYEPDDPIIRASDSLVQQGVVVVFSAGNGGPDPSHMTLEGTNPNVITVGAADDDGEVESYSSRGPIYQGDSKANWTKPDVVAPGSHIISARAQGGGPGTNYVMMNGTSMAAPHAAGAAALLLAERPALTPEQVKGVLTTTARDVGPAGVDDETGSGMLDVAGAIELLEEADGQIQHHTDTTQRQGELTGPGQAGQALQAASVDHQDSFEVEVPENATEIEGPVRWDGSEGLEVRLLDPAGSTRETWTVKTERTVRFAEPRAGTWEVELEPTGLQRGRYQAELTVTWIAEGERVELPIASQRSSSGGFPSTGGPLDPLGESWIPGIPNVVPMLAGGALTAIMVVGKLTGGRREEEPVDPGEPGSGYP